MAQPEVGSGIVRIWRNSPQNSCRESYLHLHFYKAHRHSRLQRVAIFVLLFLFSLPSFSQNSTDPAGIDSPAKSLTGDTDPHPGQLPSSYVISASRLRVPSKAVTHLEAAQRHFLKMQLAQATEELDRAIRIYPGFAQAFRLRALVHLAEKDFTASVENAAHAISLDGADAYSWVALATAYNSLNEWPEAEAAAGRALEFNPPAWQGRLELAKSFYGEARFALALSTLDQLHQDIPDIHLVRANSLMRLGRSQEAAQQFAVFLGEAPGDSRADQIRQILGRVQSTNNRSAASPNRP
jgi:tetratricopeptide (TPR) repeat protein